MECGLTNISVISRESLTTEKCYVFCAYVAKGRQSKKIHLLFYTNMEMLGDNMKYFNIFLRSKKILGVVVKGWDNNYYTGW